MSEEEKMAKLELNRYIYGKQLSKDDIADYLGILFNLIDNQQKEIEEKSTIINQLLEDMKERANNFAYETEIMWRKIEKSEKLLEENIKEENS